MNAIWAWVVQQLQQLQQLPARLLGVLDWLVAVMERVLVLTISFFVLVIGWHLLVGNFSEEQNSFILKIGEHWKLFGLLLIPLFYRTARAFLERVQKFAGMEARPLEKKEEVVNPPTTT